MEQELITPVPMTLTVRLGIRHLSLKALSRTKPGDLLALDSPSDLPLDLLLEGKIIGKCEIVSLDKKLGIRISALYDFPVNAM